MTLIKWTPKNYMHNFFDDVESMISGAFLQPDDAVNKSRPFTPFVNVNEGEKEYSISLVQLGQLATVQILFLGLGGFPAGILADRFGSRAVLMVYFAGLVIASVWMYFAIILVISCDFKM